MADPSYLRAGSVDSIAEPLEPRFLLATWYVDSGTGVSGVTGIDAANAGTTLQTPFRSINYAAQRAVAGDTVFVRAGEYREEVRPLNNGTAGALIVYMPYNSETVSIRGTSKLSTSWTQVPGSPTYYTSWPGQYTSAVNNSDQVFVNSEMVHLARWPDLATGDLSRPQADQATVDSIVSSTATGQQAWGGGYGINRIVFKDAAFTDTTNVWVGAKIWMNSGGAQNAGVDETQDGNGVTGTVIVVDGTTGTITVDIGAATATGTNQPANFQIGKGSRYYFFDPVALPASGIAFDAQWWRDRRGTADPSDDRLYLRSPNDVNPASLSVEVKQRDWAFNFDTGTGSTDNGRRYITVKDFNIFGASITTDHLAGNGSQSSDGGNLRGVTIANASNIILDGLKMKYVSHFTNQAGDLQAQWAQSSGVILSGSDNIFANGEIAWSAGSGIIVLGQRNKVLNSKVHDTNYNVTEGGAIGMGSTRKGGGPSLDAEIAYNEVYNTGVDGIQFDGLRNSTGSKNDIRARIHHNIVHDTVLQSADSGGIKMFGADGRWVRIDHNIIYNTGGTPSASQYLFYGIYLDYTATTTGGYVIDHNVVYATPIGININHNYNTEVYNNTLLQPAIVGRHSIGNDAGGTMDGVVIRNNLANRSGRGLSGTGINSVLSNNVFNAVEATTWFVDPLNSTISARNYSLASNATTTAATGAIDRGVSVSPFDDAIIGQPDLGAREYGAPQWTAGVGQVSTPTSWVISGVVYRDGNRDGIRNAGESGLAGRTVYLDANGNGALDAATNRSFAYSGAPVAIPDRSGSNFGIATATFTVPAGSGAIAALRVTLDIRHTYDGDLYGFLIAPDGTSVELMAGNGGGGDNFSVTTFDDTAGATIGSAAAPYNGTFRPTGALSALNGKTAAGVWTLRIEDRFDADVGTINAFSIAYGTAGETSTATAADGSYAFTNLASGIYAVSQIIPTGWSAVSPVTARSVNHTAGTSVIDQNFSSYQNSTPTFAAASAISPVPPTTSAAATLTVLGADANGENNLTYTWSTIAKPSGAADAVFGANGTNAAKSTGVTFSASGSYTLRATITNAAGTSASSDLLVNVNAAPAVPTVQSVAVNEGAAQRSMVTRITYVFSTAVTPAAGAFTLTRRSDGQSVSPNVTNPAGDGRTYVLTFSGTGIVGNSLADGIYDLAVDASKVTDAYGQTLTGGGGLAFHRIFGDQDGDRDVDATDSRAFRAALDSTLAQAPYRMWFDYDLDGDIDATDSRAFRARLNTLI